MTKGKIIAFSGTHGTGKTTAVYALAAEMKKAVKGEVGIILETARRCPFPICKAGEEMVEDAQLWIFAEQIRCELEAAQRYDLVISDRTAVDCIAYSSVGGFHELAYGQVAVARRHLPIYKKIIFLGAQDNPYHTDDCLRHKDPQLRLEVELRLLDLYRELGVKLERG